MASCSGTTTLPDADGRAFADSVDAIVENALDGLSENDFEKHTSDFDDDMKKSIDEVAFPQVYDEIIGKLGLYQSRTFVRVDAQGSFYIVYYSAVFENEPEASIRFVFNKDDPDHKISGMWFDSPLLRSQ
jgi:hypothetical protein